VIFIEAPPASMPEPASTPAQPLLIEWQGNRYVRISGDEASGAETLDRPAAAARQTPKTPDRIPSPAAVPELPLAVLIFLDGHREQVSGYTISGASLYALSNFYSNGSWSRKIELASLNLPETLDENRSRGIRFRLPSAPNEVIVGP
jgi:hypothetical protein